MGFVEWVSQLVGHPKLTEPAPSHAAARPNFPAGRGGTVSIAMLEATIDVLGGESSRGHLLGLGERARRLK